MTTFYQEILETDLGPLEKLVTQWRTTRDALAKLPKRVHDEMLTPLRDKGYWEGVAAPYAWRMIDDIERQIDSAAKVADAVIGVMEDALGDFKVVKKDLQDAVRRAQEKGVFIQASGAVATTVFEGQCKVIEKDSPEAKAIEGAQREIDGIVKRGIIADRNLAFALMSDVGLGQWFNSKPQHSNIDTTDKISHEDYNALNLAMQGKDPYPAHKGEGAYSLGWDYGTGSGPREREYHDGDQMTELIKKSVSMDQLRADTLADWQEHGSQDGTVSYSISKDGKVGALKKLFTTDLPAIFTNDEEHLGEAFVGSYSLDYNVKGQDPDGSLVVEYTLNNSTSNESLLHYIGYYKWLEKTNREDGMLSTIDQKITWTERIPADRK
ncbi:MULTISPECIES: hypothetical protein [unclassified Streptomyces]|uniref:hypothetical protein n=1 Tax=unclassified Streptomyces TaxID=2593676 RepID=UPI001BE583CA|nr:MULTISPECIES: hypothetical protein [unclassified Streptomyces]MBT2408482.1 hypothetical protein [Streptomyces sp. ISL-21]MBT2611919.1 hypothetical protein [Streptomyces sp. ISL-87]